MMPAVLLALGVVELAYIVRAVTRPDPAPVRPAWLRALPARESTAREQLAAGWTRRSEHLADRTGCLLRRRSPLLRSDLALRIPPAPAPAAVVVPVARVVRIGRPPARRVPGATLAASGIAA